MIFERLQEAQREHKGEKSMPLALPTELQLPAISTHHCGWQQLSTASWLPHFNTLTLLEYHFQKFLSLKVNLHDHL